MSRRVTKDQRIDALRAALAKLSAETKGYYEFSAMGSLHKIAHEALLADSICNTKVPKAAGSTS